MEANALLTVTEAARRLGISNRHLRRLIREERMPATRAGERFYLIEPSDLENVEIRRTRGRPKAAG